MRRGMGMSLNPRAETERRRLSWPVCGLLVLVLSSLLWVVLGWVVSAMLR